ncbi:MAG: 6-phosphogluconolactonase [Prolixibacteraceae bacterium]
MKKEFYVDQLHVYASDTRLEMAEHAALKAGKAIISMLQSKKTLNIIFAAAPSQNEFLEALTGQPEIEWQRINAFHMDEYIGLSENAPQSFGAFLNERIFTKVPFKSVHLINGQKSAPEGECVRYSKLLQTFPPDMVFMGIGENGHIAFNDPHVALFNDPESIKIVDLDLVSRVQQVHDGCFSNLNEVPHRALTLTIPALMRAEKIFCIVPATTKAQAVFNTLNQPVIEKYPSTILRTHASAELFLDADSAALIP